MKNAYMIMAHEKKDQLLILIKLLDHSDNELYIHIDAKSSISIDELKSTAVFSPVHIYKKFCIYWGDISQTLCQFFLLNEAVKNKHDYYHLLSGTDLPIKSNGYISDFLYRNMGKQFINFDSQQPAETENVSMYHLPWYGINRVNHESVVYKLLWIIDKVLIRIQKFLNIKSGLYKGCNWFSVTHDFAVDFLKNREIIIKKIRWIISSDECAIQYYYKYINNSWELFSESSDYISIMRLIDWQRGTPYVWTIEDKDELQCAEHLFARKFDIDKDREIIMFLENLIRN